MDILQFMLRIALTFSLLAAGITANKYILYFLNPMWFVALRMSISGTVLIAYNIYRMGDRSWGRFLKDWKLLLLIAICTTLLPALLKAFGLKYMFAAKSTLLGSIDPFVTSILAYFILGESLTWRKALGIGLGFIGLIIVALSRTPPEVNWELFYRISYPEIAVVVASIISRYGWMRAQKLLKSERYAPSEINGAIMMISGLAGFGLVAISQEPLYATPSIPFTAVVAFGATIMLANVFGYILYARLLKSHSATLISLAGFLVPLLVALFAYLCLSEPLDLSFFIASAIIFSGLVLVYCDPQGELRTPK